MSNNVFKFPAVHVNYDSLALKNFSEVPFAKYNRRSNELYNQFVARLTNHNGPGRHEIVPEYYEALEKLYKEISATYYQKQKEH